MSRGLFILAIVLFMSAVHSARAQEARSLPSKRGHTVHRLGLKRCDPDPITRGIAEAKRSWLFGADSGVRDLSSTLLRTDSLTGAMTTAAETGIYALTDLAFIPDGTLYGVTFTSLYSISPRDGSRKRRGDLDLSNVNALASDPQGRLYFATSEGLVGTVFKSTGQIKKIGDFGGGLGCSGDLAFSVNGELYATAFRWDTFDDFLVTVNPASGAATIIGSIGFPDVFGLAFGSDGKLYGAARGTIGDQPKLIVIDVRTGTGRFVADLPSNDGLYGLAPLVRSSPVKGGLSTIIIPGISSSPNAAGLWTFWQHRTGFHRSGGGIKGSDDTYAWDINLENNLDKGKPVYAVAAGKVVRYAGLVLPGGSSGAVLIEHKTGNLKWWSGYLHMSHIRVKENQTITSQTVLGNINHVSPHNVPDHLHLVFYEGQNKPGKLISIDATFYKR